MKIPKAQSPRPKGSHNGLPIYPSARREESMPSGTRFAWMLRCAQNDKTKRLSAAAPTVRLKFS